jgi:hypothetical protein
MVNEMVVVVVLVVEVLLVAEVVQDHPLIIKQMIHLKKNANISKKLVFTSVSKYVSAILILENNLQIVICFLCISIY